MLIQNFCKFSFSFIKTNLFFFEKLKLKSLFALGLINSMRKLEWISWFFLLNVWNTSSWRRKLNTLMHKHLVLFIIILIWFEPFWFIHETNLGFLLLTIGVLSLLKLIFWLSDAHCLILSCEELLWLLLPFHELAHASFLLIFKNKVLF